MDAIAKILDNPTFYIITDLLKRGDRRFNKELLLIARHMGLSQGTGAFHKLTQYATDILLSSLSPPRPKTNTPVYDPSHYEQELNTFFSHPLYTGATIMSCFLAPLSDDQVQQVTMESYMKEINVMDGDSHGFTLDFTPFFGQYDNSLSPTIAPNPRMAKVVHHAINSWLHKQEAKLHFPKMSRKLLPSFTRSQMDVYVDKLLEDPSLATPSSLEWLRVGHGITLEGGCELSQRWYTNGLTPRSYFVAGATAYNKSCFLKNFWNDLVDELSVTNKINRVNPRRLHYDGVKQALFYDLTSFTSNMACQKDFLNVLAAYCYGRSTQIMDGRSGAMTVDIGELIAEYNDLNCLPEYRTKLFDSSFGELRHGVAGFLGVFGNIATCTFLHGAVLLQLCTSELECSCAGDDAVAFVEDEESVWACVSLLGILAPEKTYRLSDHDVVYLKRRTWADLREFCLRQASYIQLPSMLLHVDKKTLSRFREHTLSRRQLKGLAASSLQATFRSAARLSYHSTALVDTRDFLDQYYSLHGFPVRGSFPQALGTHSGGDNFVPSLNTIGSAGFIRDTIFELSPPAIVLPDRRDQGPGFGRFPIFLKAGTRFRTRLDAYGRYLERLGFLNVVARPKVTWYGEDALEKLAAEFDRTEFLPSPILVYEVVQDVPDWICGGVQIEGSYEFDFSYMSNVDAHETDESVSGYRESPPRDDDDWDLFQTDDDL